jgi:hypothetical protein
LLPAKLSSVRALVRASELLEEAEWLRQARHFAEMLNAERIASDRKLYLMS